ncbi:hypothetical protein TNIN_281221 [Trichonephila inaurata madagascariensis]|uniref:Uncharacterized protein n=1 Tax=Trichonephila inaurata madagascariensis TaxID=2747483 RepID=A0A8X6YQT5_9ARAC|nr:hypothetical protein TNIN_281221 [Trichonephila inaurata madagascariensis]
MSVGRRDEQKIPPHNIIEGDSLGYNEVLMRGNHVLHCTEIIICQRYSVTDILPIQAKLFFLTYVFLRDVAGHEFLFMNNISTSHLQWPLRE